MVPGDDFRTAIVRSTGELAALVIVMLTGYGLFLLGWSGSLADVTKVVIWAFAIDLSVAGPDRPAHHPFAGKPATVGVAPTARHTPE